MDDRSLEAVLNKTNKTVFTTQDFDKYWQYENYRSLIQRISYLNKSGKLNKIKRGLYSIEGREVNKLELANRLRTPSFVSFESVLHKEGLIFQWDQRITVAAQVSREIEVLNTTFVYRKLKDEILLNSTGVLNKDTYFIAEKERALLDMLYIDPSFTFDNLRSVDFDMVKELLPIYKRQSLENKVKELEKNVKSY